MRQRRSYLYRTTYSLSRAAAVITASAAIVFSGLIPFSSPPSASSAPLDGNGLDAVVMDWPWYDNTPPEVVCSPSGDGTGLNIPNGTSESNGREIFNFFVSHGYKPYQAAAIVGNITVESGILPQRLYGTPASVITTAEAYIASGSNVAWGMVQWLPGTKIINAIGAARANNLGGQIEFLYGQLEGKAPAPQPLWEVQAGKDLKAAPDIREAVLAFQGNTRVGGKYMGFERPGDQTGTVSQRLGYAQAALLKYGSGAAATGSPAVPGDVQTNTGSATVCNDGATIGGAVSPDGKFALPVDKKYYDAHPDWFSKPHHDYPSADIPVSHGVPIYSMTSGKIIAAPAGAGCGLGVIIDAGNGVQITYCHGTDGGSVAGAKQGDTVKPGQLIMHTDNTGDSQGPHLHLQIKVNGKLVCPQNLLVALGKGSATVPDIKSLPTSGCSY